ncbi:insulin-degrading-like enzyme, metalloprotease family M16A [Thraustotheca clavata]|uniref:Insulin-degrading-like enzyme, metalloprotease family M16A n=1 Tax=Thraustotheca clavata TaxID=74557 RepID=A0A1V9ZBQ1_9STRA|nr:insulin-degrading-like enzyme, metalloprotease family M16A [Thraustotheca clavata]
MVVRCSGGIQVSAMDTREYAHFTLPNGLDVLVISDPSTEQAAAALTVGVGFLSDPQDIPGLAHFCEHMLFLGTEKYPDENAFQNFISAHFGSTNAYTTSVQTTYYFDIAPLYLTQALDYFSAFFTCPLFTQSATNREMQAVHSEHSANIQSDVWRHQQVLRAIGNPNHAYQKFGTGTFSTLNQPHVREALLEYHSKYYTAGRMKLVVTGKESVAELQNIVSSFFQDIPVDQQCKCHPYLMNLANTASTPCPILYNVNGQLPYMPEQLGQHVKIVPVIDQHCIHLLFPVPPISPTEYGVDAHSMLSEILGHEGDGSLLSLFKSKHWAYMLSAGVFNDEVEWTFFTISIKCTAQGMQHLSEIVDYTFQMVQLVQEDSLSNLTWRANEYVSLYQLEIQFHEKEDPASYCAHLASRLHIYPPKYCVTGDILNTNLCISDYEKTLAVLNSSNMLLVSVSYAYLNEATKVEPWYGTQYSTEQIDRELINKWATLKPKSEELALYSPNIFIPENLDILPYTEGSGPKILRNDSHCRFWYLPDYTYKQPKVFLSLRFASGALGMNPYSSIFTDMFVECVNEVLNPIAYDASRAGLNYQLHEGVTSLTLMVDGFSSTVPKFTDMILSRLTNFVISNETFERVHETVLRKYDNFVSYIEPQQHAEWICKELLYHYFVGFEDLTQVMSAWTIKEFQNMTRELFHQCHVTGLVQGNMSEQNVKEWLNSIVSTVLATPDKSVALPPDFMSYSRMIELPTGQYLYKTKGRNAANNNSVVRAMYQVTPIATALASQSYWTNCAALYTQLTMDLCFATLRTEEQLGYTVYSGLSTMGNILYYSVVVESATYSPNHVQQRIDAFHIRCREYLINLSTEVFQKHIQTLVQSWLQAPTSLYQETNRAWSNILLHLPPLSTNANDAMLLQTLRIDDVMAFYDQFIDPRQAAVLSIHVYGRPYFDEMTLDPTNPQLITTIEAFKQNKNLFPRPVVHPLDEEVFNKTGAKCWHE